VFFFQVRPSLVECGSKAEIFESYASNYESPFDRLRAAMGHPQFSQLILFAAKHGHGLDVADTANGEIAGADRDRCKS